MKIGQVVSGVAEHGGAETVAEAIDHRLNAKAYTLYSDIDSDTFKEIGTEEEKEKIEELGLTTMDA